MNLRELRAIESTNTFFSTNHHFTVALVQTNKIGAKRES
jgi:hypothetical protein